MLCQKAFVFCCTKRQYIKSSGVDLSTHRGKRRWRAVYHSSIREKGKKWGKEKQVGKRERERRCASPVMYNKIYIKVKTRHMAGQMRAHTHTLSLSHVCDLYSFPIKGLWCAQWTLNLTWNGVCNPFYFCNVAYFWVNIQWETHWTTTTKNVGRDFCIHWDLIESWNMGLIVSLQSVLEDSY